MTRSGAVDATAPFSSSSLPLPISVAGSGLGRRCSISPAMSAPALVASSRNSAIDSSVEKPRSSWSGDMEERRSCVAGYAGAGRDRAGGSRTGRGRGVRVGSRLCRRHRPCPLPRPSPARGGGQAAARGRRASHVHPLRAPREAHLQSGRPRKSTKARTLAARWRVCG